MATPESIRPRRRVRAYLLRESVSWLNGGLAIAGLLGLGSALGAVLHVLTGTDGEVLVAAPGYLGMPRTVEDIPFGLRLLDGSEQLMTGLALCLGAWMLRKVLLSISAGEPFEPRNPRRLRLLALAVFGGTTVAPVVAYWSDRAVLAHDGADPGDAYLPLNLWAPFVALAVLAGAQAFSHGRALDDDVDGLV